MRFGKVKLAMLVGAACSLFATSAFAGDVKDAETGITFSGEKSVWGKTWVAVGAAAREKYSFNVYAVALYVEKDRGGPGLQSWLSGDGSAYGSGGKVDVGKAQKDNKLYKALLNCGCGRGVEIKMARAVSGPDIKAAFLESLAKQIDISGADVKDDVTKLGDFLNYDIAKGGQYKFYVSAGNSLSATGPGGDLTIKNAKLAKAFLSIYIGSKPIQSDIKASLISNINALL